MIKSILAQTKCPIWFHFLVAGFPETEAIPSLMESLGAWKIIPLNQSASPKPARGSQKLPESFGYVNRTVPGRAAVLYSLHPLPGEMVEDQAKILQLYPLAHHAGVPGMAKFFLPEILWQVKRALYLDVDMLLAGDIQDLWAYFQVYFQKDKDLLYFMGNNHPEGHNRRRLLRPFCSCQLVLHLERMRKVNTTQVQLYI